MWTIPAHLAYIVLSPILSTVLALINVMTIYVFCRKFRLATMSLFIIVNICACDIFVCLISNTFYVANILHPTYAWTTGSLCCKLFKFLTMVTNVAQIYLLCFLNADRLRRLIDTSDSQWRKRHGRCFVVISWMFAAALCLPRLWLFDVKEVKRFSTEINATEIVNYNCKPVGLTRSANTAITISTFVLAYALPACFIIYTLVHSQVFMWARRRRIHLSTTKNAVLKMSSKLALTFNLTAALFMLVWTPFFVLSLVDLKYRASNSAPYINANFSLRCTLLILGSAKPLIYFACLDKFRSSFRCGFANEKPEIGEISYSSSRSRETGVRLTSVSESKVCTTSTA